MGKITDEVFILADKIEAIRALAEISRLKTQQDKRCLVENFLLDLNALCEKHQLHILNGRCVYQEVRRILKGKYIIASGEDPMIVVWTDEDGGSL